MLLHATHLVPPDALPGLIDQHSKLLGVESAVLYLADLDQRWLTPVVSDDTQTIEPLEIEGTMAGRCFRSFGIVDTVGKDNRQILWVPVVDGTERLGVLQVAWADGDDCDRSEAVAFAALIAELVMSKRAYGDFFEFKRRRKPLTIAAELLWQLLPPLTFGTPEIAITASFVPTADLGGDAFDYGIDLRRARFAIFDAVGHGLGAGLMATAAIAAYRNGRRRRLELSEMSGLIGQAVEDHFGESEFVTGIIASLDIETGLLSWSVAGHPAPLLLRGGRVVKHMDPGTGMPFGLGPASPVFEEQLEPGDRVLLYTDGVTEARDASGEFFGVERLVDLVARTSGDDPPAETMRRLMHAIEDHNDGPMRDDATVVMVEWRGDGGIRMSI
jgi:serine phosphatase RsbU (regulator of sigma subunit)